MTGIPKRRAKRFALFALAIERASVSDPDRCCAILANTDVPADSLMHVSVDTLAGLCQGPVASTWWAKLRSEAHELAMATRAPDVQLRATLHVVAVAEARERGAGLRLSELQEMSDYTDADIACVACQLAGMVAAARYGDRLSALQAQIRRHYGIGGAA